MADVTIHPSGEVSPYARIGGGSHVWNNAQIRERARIGRDCIIGKNVYVDADVVLGDCVKVENNVSIYRGVTIEDGVFIGPHVCFSNDVFPRAITYTGALKSCDDWVVGRTVVRTGASIGAVAIILPNVTIGAFSLIGAGSVVTRSVPAQTLVYGNPARPHAWVCCCGRPLVSYQPDRRPITVACVTCHAQHTFGVGDPPASSAQQRG